MLTVENETRLAADSHENKWKNECGLEAFPKQPILHSPHQAIFSMLAGYEEQDVKDFIRLFANGFRQHNFQIKFLDVIYKLNCIIIKANFLTNQKYQFLNETICEIVVGASVGIEKYHTFSVL